MIRRLGAVLLILACVVPSVLAEETPSEEDVSFSRLIIYDVRGQRKDETVVILEQKDKQVKVWLQDYLGKRSGAVPYEEYRACFLAMRQIRKFALKKKYRGKLLRTSAAHGLITLAWQDNKKGKQIQTIKYYAPEHTLDDFRQAFNNIWALSRYAILSINAFENPRVEFLEDAVYFMSGAGWMTRAEIESVVAFHRLLGHEERVIRSIWRSLSQKYPRASEFNKRSYLEYCVKKAMQFMGGPAAVFLEKRLGNMPHREKALAEEIIRGIREARP